MGEPKEVDGWNVAELAGGLLLSADDFLIQLDTAQVDKFLDILNSGQPGDVRDERGNIVMVSSPEKHYVVLKKVGDKTYPDGIILPVEAFSEVDDDDLTEGVKPAFRRVGTKIKRGFRVTTGRRKGRVVSSPDVANKPPAKALTRAKLRAAAHRNKLIRALKSKLTRRKSASIRLRRMNHTD